MIKSLDSEVIELIEDEETLATEIEQADGYKETIYSTLTKINRATKPPIGTPPPATPIDIPATPSDACTSRIRLPKIQLHSFGGDLTKLTSFWESFQSAVHENRELSDIEKFNYLNSLLEHCTREAVLGLFLTATNYHKAIKTL